ncbi:uncharacterized protein [Diadema setosum]|uniref:uncharacterized protein n=1 Tax=Diadema setosum TaxID=31175 RepID=UPI003B3A6480
MGTGQTKVGPEKPSDCDDTSKGSSESSGKKKNGLLRTLIDAFFGGKSADEGDDLSRSGSMGSGTNLDKREQEDATIYESQCSDEPALVSSEMDTRKAKREAPTGVRSRKQHNERKSSEETYRRSPPSHISGPILAGDMGMTNQRKIENAFRRAGMKYRMPTVPRSIRPISPHRSARTTKKPILPLSSLNGAYISNSICVPTATKSTASASNSETGKIPSNLVPSAGSTETCQRIDAQSRSSLGSPKCYQENEMKQTKIGPQSDTKPTNNNTMDYRKLVQSRKTHCSTFTQQCARIASSTEERGEITKAKLGKVGSQKPSSNSRSTLDNTKRRLSTAVLKTDKPTGRINPITAAEPCSKMPLKSPNAECKLNEDNLIGGCASNVNTVSSEDASFNSVQQPPGRENSTKLKSEIGDDTLLDPRNPLYQKTSTNKKPQNQSAISLSLKLSKPVTGNSSQRIITMRVRNAAAGASEKNGDIIGPSNFTNAVTHAVSQIPKDNGAEKREVEVNLLGNHALRNDLISSELSSGHTTVKRGDSISSTALTQNAESQQFFKTGYTLRHNPSGQAGKDRLNSTRDSQATLKEASNTSVAFNQSEEQQQRPLCESFRKPLPSKVFFTGNSSEVEKKSFSKTQTNATGKTDEELKNCRFFPKPPSSRSQTEVATGVTQKGEQGLFTLARSRAQYITRRKQGLGRPVKIADNGGAPEFSASRRPLEPILPSTRQKSLTSKVPRPFPVMHRNRISPDDGKSKISVEPSNIIRPKAKLSTVDGQSAAAVRTHIDNGDREPALPQQRVRVMSSPEEIKRNERQNKAALTAYPGVLHCIRDNRLLMPFQEWSISDFNKSLSLSLGKGCILVESQQLLWTRPITDEHIRQLSVCLDQRVSDVNAAMKKYFPVPVTSSLSVRELRTVKLNDATFRELFHVDTFGLERKRAPVLFNEKTYPRLYLLPGFYDIELSSVNFFVHGAQSLPVIIEEREKPSICSKPVIREGGAAATRMDTRADNGRDRLHSGYNKLCKSLERNSANYGSRSQTGDMNKGTGRKKHKGDVVAKGKTSSRVDDAVAECFPEKRIDVCERTQQPKNMVSVIPRDSKENKYSTDDHRDVKYDTFSTLDDDEDSSDEFWKFISAPIKKSAENVTGKSPNRTSQVIPVPRELADVPDYVLSLGTASAAIQRAEPQTQPTPQTATADEQATVSEKNEIERKSVPRNKVSEPKPSERKSAPGNKASGSNLPEQELGHTLGKKKSSEDGGAIGNKVSGTKPGEKNRIIGNIISESGQSEEKDAARNTLCETNSSEGKDSSASTIFETKHSDGNGATVNTQTNPAEENGATRNTMSESKQTDEESANGNTVSQSKSAAGKDLTGNTIAETKPCGRQHATENSLSETTPNEKKAETGNAVSESKESGEEGVAGTITASETKPSEQKCGNAVSSTQSVEGKCAVENKVSTTNAGEKPRARGNVRRIVRCQRRRRTDTPTTQLKIKFCLACGDTRKPNGEPLMKCGTCDEAFFCSNKCQKETRNKHRETCKGVKRHYCRH